MNLDTLPDRMKALPIDERGYPIPWFVGYIDGKPEFRAMDAPKWHRAIRDRLCWVCGQPLGVNVAFVAGAMCGINRISAEPPSHLECARWSAIHCPFLSNPNMVRREDEVVNSEKVRDVLPGFTIMRNPGVAMVWVTRSFEIVPGPKNSKLLVMGEPTRVEWYREGRSATRAEVQESVDSGLPNLEAVARQEKGGLQSLQRDTQRFMRYLPE